MKKNIFLSLSHAFSTGVAKLFWLTATGGKKFSSKWAPHAFKTQHFFLFSLGLFLTTEVFPQPFRFS
jgi:hypothetical protein